MKLADRLLVDSPILMDGAMNTEMSNRGVNFNNLQWVRANVESADLIGDLHGAYAHAGAQLHIANTFATAKHVTEDFGVVDQFEALNRAGVEVCRAAVDEVGRGQQWIAGSISTFAKGHDRDNLPSLATLEKNCAQQAGVLADAGCDMIALEMLFDIDHSVAMLRGAATAGLPVSVGIVARNDDDGELYVQKKRPGEASLGNIELGFAVDQILDRAPADASLVMTIMHSFFDATGPALEVVRTRWDGPMGAYPNIGRYKAPGGWDVTGEPDARAFADACEQWAQMGVRIIGGCCGVGPQYIAAVKRRALFADA